MKQEASIQEINSPATISVLVLVPQWPLSYRYQQQLLILAQFEVVHELILPVNQRQELPPLLKKEPKLRSFQLTSDSFSHMAEAGAFEADADALLILKQDLELSAKMLQEIPLAISRGFEFGGLIKGSKRWWSGLLKLATYYCKGLCWFHLCQGYFMSRKIYHHSGGFKEDGRLISFFELLCKQQKISSYTFLFLSNSKQSRLKTD